MTNKYCKNREKFKVTQKYKFQYVYTFKSQTFKKNPIKIYIKAIKRNAPLYLFFYVKSTPAVKRFKAQSRIFDVGQNLNP